MSLKRFFNESLNMTKSERNASLVLLILIGIELLLSFTLHSNTDNKVKPDTAAFSNKIKEFEKKFKNDTVFENKLDRFIEKIYDTLQLFPFNPNKTTAKNYEKLGLSSKQVKTVMKYLSNGGKFVVKEDFKRVFGIRPKQYEKLQKYITLPSQKQFYEEDTEISRATDHQKTEKSIDTSKIAAKNLTIEELTKRGISQKTAQNIVKFAEKGAIFRKIDDFKKIYGIKSEEVIILEKICTFENRVSTKVDSIQKKKTIIVVKKLEMNTVTEAELKTIKGIGNYFASGYIKFRELLGGYSEIEQIKELYHMNDTVYSIFTQYLFLDSKPYRKININGHDTKALAKHPYLGKILAQNIVEYMEKNGPYKEIEEISKLKILTNRQLKKILPYLSTKE